MERKNNFVAANCDPVARKKIKELEKAVFGGTEMVEKVVFDSASAELKFMDMGAYTTAILPAGFDLKAGKTYTVHLDGKTYERTAFETPLGGNDTIFVMLGNAGLDPLHGLENTGEPFTFGIGDGMKVMAITSGMPTEIKITTMEEQSVGGSGGGGGRLETTETVVFDAQDIGFSDNGNGTWKYSGSPMSGDTYFPVEGGKTYNVWFQGVKYTCTAADQYNPYLGNLAIDNPSYEDTGEPFLFKMDGAYVDYFTNMPSDKQEGNKAFYDIKAEKVETNLVFDGNGGITNVAHVGSDGNRYLGSVAMGDVYPCTDEMIVTMIERFGDVCVQTPPPEDSGFVSGFATVYYYGYGRNSDGTLVLFGGD